MLRVVRENSQKVMSCVLKVHSKQTTLIQTTAVHSCPHTATFIAKREIFVPMGGQEDQNSIASNYSCKTMFYDFEFTI